MTIAKRIEQLLQWHGVTLRGLSRLLDIDVAYLSRLKAGEKTNPSEAILRKLNLRKVVDYQIGREAEP